MHSWNIRSWFLFGTCVLGGIGHKSPHALHEVVDLPVGLSNLNLHREDQNQNAHDDDQCDAIHT
jgi:hypothetical protein